MATNTEMVHTVRGTESWNVVINPARMADAQHDLSVLVEADHIRADANRMLVVREYVAEKQDLLTEALRVLSH